MLIIFYALKKRYISQMPIQLQSLFAWFVRR